MSGSVERKGVTGTTGVVLSSGVIMGCCYTIIIAAGRLRQASGTMQYDARCLAPWRATLRSGEREWAEPSVVNGDSVTWFKTLF